jgi:hypothetical protein
MKFFKKLLKSQQTTPLKIVTDKLRSYLAAKRDVMPNVEHLHNTTKTTAVNCLISLVDNENGKCGVLNLEVRLNDFYRAMAFSITCLDLADIT